MIASPLGPDAVIWQGTHYKTVLTSRETGGAMAIVDTVSPPGYGPPRHVHADADETFVILSGHCEFWYGKCTFSRGPGESVFVPRGREHTFRVIGTQPSRHLVILTPGGFEGFFEEMAREGCRIPEDMERITSIGQRYGLRFTGAPLAAVPQEQGSKAK